MDAWLSKLRRIMLGGSRPLQRRLTVLTMLAVAVTLVTTSLVGWAALRVTLFDISERGSLLISRDLVSLARHDIATTGRLSERVLGAGSTVVLAVRADGTVLAVPGEDISLVVGEAEVQAARQQEQTVRNTTASTAEVYRLVTVPLDEPGWVLVVGRPLTASYEILHVFGLVVLIVGVAGLGWAWLIGRTVAATALRPVRSFTEAVRHVAATDDLHPVPAPRPGELSALTEAFNQMLARLAHSRYQQNRLIADASHELRTPLTSMRTNIELLTLDARHHRLNDTARATILADVHAQTVEFSDLIADLVHLARDTTTVNKREPVELRTVVEKAVARVRRRGADLTFDTSLDSTVVLGEAGSLAQAVTNLLDNAVKWSPPGGTVHIRLHDYQLQVSDEGLGIADADLPHVFDRFYRSETARSTPGTGLGLAITAQAVHDHGGTIRASHSSWGGAEFTIDLPGSPRASTPAHVDGLDAASATARQLEGRATS